MDEWKRNTWARLSQRNKKYLSRRREGGKLIKIVGGGGGLNKKFKWVRECDVMCCHLRVGSTWLSSGGTRIFQRFLMAQKTGPSLATAHFIVNEMGSTCYVLPYVLCSTSFWKIVERISVFFRKSFESQTITIPLRFFGNILIGLRVLLNKFFHIRK